MSLPKYPLACDSKDEQMRQKAEYRTSQIYVNKKLRILEKNKFKVAHTVASNSLFSSCVVFLHGFKMTLETRHEKTCIRGLRPG